MKNPAMTALIGLGYEESTSTIGAMYAHHMLLFMAITIAIMNILMVSRHSRGDEEEGRLEMLRSLPTGRLTNLFSTLTVSFMINVLTAMFTGISIGILKIDSMPFSSSIFYGFTLGATGFLFSSLTAIFAQLCETKRGTVGFSLGFLGILFLMRAVLDVSAPDYSWISPLSWCYLSKAYAGDILIPPISLLLLGILLSSIALYLCSIRDLGAGFISEKKGRTYASKFLLTPLGFAFRLQRTSFIAWSITSLVIGATYGSIFGDLDSFFKNNDMLKKVIVAEGSASLTESFMSFIMVIMAIVSAIPTIMFILKIINEEKQNRLDIVFSGTVSRYTELFSYFIISFISSILMLFLSISGMFFTSLSVMKNPISYGEMLKTGFSYLPAIWIMIGTAIFLIGFLPRFTNIVWGYLSFSFTVVYLGNILNIPDYIKKISPFGNIPQFPVDEFNTQVLLFISLIAIILTILGFIGYKNRDIT